MALENLLEELIEAINKNTAALAGSASAAAVEEPEEEEEEEEEPPKKAAPAKRGRPAKKKAGPTEADCRAAATKVKDALGLKAANAVLKEFEVKKVSELEEEDYQEFIEACEEALEESDD